MYIKKFSTSGKVIVVNMDISSYGGFFADGNKVKFDTGRTQQMFNDDGEPLANEYGDPAMEIVYDTLTFETNEKAEDARDRIFERLGMKNPMSNVLDLTIPKDVLVENDAETVDNELTEDDLGHEEEIDDGELI